jgi:cephalosporin-C deacetylase
MRNRHFVLLVLALFASIYTPQCRANGALSVSCEKPDGVYQLGQTIRWQVRWNGPDDATSANYSLKTGGRTEIEKGPLTFDHGAATITAKLEKPNTILAIVTVATPDGTEYRAVGGAVAAPDKILPAAPVPADFHAFWAAKVAELEAVPPNPVLTPVDSEKPDVDYWKITLDNIGKHIQGQIARPKSGEKFPALLIPQWAGVYGLEKTWVTDRAAEGWLALDLCAHDIPIDQPKAFYKDQFNGPLKNYWAIGNDDPNTSYFLPMYLSCYRAAQYLQSRPDWDGKTLVVSGGSQGGQQSIMIAGLYPHFTAVLAIRPAGGDMRAPDAGRAPGWPMWYDWTQNKDPEKVRHAGEYFDPANFAPDINCPVLVSLGLLDEIAPPSSVLAIANRISSPKEIIIMPHATHQSESETSKPYYNRWGLWMWNLRQGKPVPVQQ